MTRTEKKELRRMVADLLAASGCGCCSDREGWERAQAELAKVLRVPKWLDGSGFNFSKFRTPR
jgi:hypothetical protein